VRSASGDDGRKLFQCGAQRARIQGPRCNEPVRPSTIYDATEFTYLNRIRNTGCKSTSTYKYMDGANF
jgi:hypothetical protein